MCIAAVSNAAMPNDAASIAIPVAGLVAWMMRPASAPPTISEPLQPRPSMAFAGCSFDSGTVCGTIPLEAGKKNAQHAPATASERGHLPDLRMTGEQQDRDRGLARARDDIRDDHHAVAREPVGPDPADEQEQRASESSARPARSRGRPSSRSGRGRRTRARRSRTSCRGTRSSAPTTAAGSPARPMASYAARLSQ